MEVDSNEKETSLDKFEELNICGLTSDQQKVYEVIKKNDTEEGADIESDFSHLSSKSKCSIYDNSHT